MGMDGGHRSAFPQVVNAIEYLSPFLFCAIACVHVSVLLFMPFIISSVHYPLASCKDVSF